MVLSECSSPSTTRTDTNKKAQSCNFLHVYGQYLQHLCAYSYSLWNINNTTAFFNEDTILIIWRVLNKIGIKKTSAYYIKAWQTPGDFNIVGFIITPFIIAGYGIQWMSCKGKSCCLRKLYWTESGFSWWRHQMETSSALLAICAGNSQVTGEFPTQRPVTQSFDVFFDLCLNKQSKQRWGWWFEMSSRSLWCHCNAKAQFK